MDWKKLTIGEFASLYPGAIGVLNKHNIDFCCGGHRYLTKAFEEQENLEPLLELAMAEKTDAKKSLAPFTQSELIVHILENFHDKHRRDIPELIQLAKKIEEVHFDNQNVPHGLADFLMFMQEDLESHMLKEETILFPLIKNAPGARPMMPIKVMMSEHKDHKKTLEALSELTNNFRPPEGACYSWQSLYQSLEKFVEELKEHIHLENNILFPRALEEGGARA